jgi:hypothetical protein
MAQAFMGGGPRIGRRNRSLTPEQLDGVMAADRLEADRPGQTLEPGGGAAIAVYTVRYTHTVDLASAS